MTQLRRVFFLLTGVTAAIVMSSAAAGATSVTRVTNISVTAGKPSEFGFTLSKKTMPSGTVTFTVTNKGNLPHDFKVCTAVGTKLANACVGRVTAPILPGKSAKLTVTFPKAGKHEFLCAVSGHAAAGMKGILTVSAGATMAPKTTNVAVAAGKPSEFGFTLSRKSMPHGVVTFTVTNKGNLPHDFKVCTAVGTKLANACIGRVTAPILPGKSAKLTVTFPKAGKHEFLCAVSGHAAAGMKGILTVT
jgi:uncharacterized cupredoxin-like copper-binding protein